jgi:hypothetical protein
LTHARAVVPAPPFAPGSGPSPTRPS